MDVSRFQIAFLKSQFAAVIKFFENVNDFQMYQDNFMNQKRVNIEDFYQSPERLVQKREAFAVGLMANIIRDVKLLAYEGKTIPKQQLQDIDEEAKIADPAVKEVYERFVQYENMLLLKNWTDSLVAEKFDDLDSLLGAQQQDAS